MRGFVGSFTSPDPDLPVVAFDGAIYNRSALRAELAAAGTPLLPDGDEALVLALYARHGAACVEKLRGPFALAIRDGETGLLARDASGLRALYYFQDASDGRLMFATGVRRLAESGDVAVRINARGLYGFFRHGAVPEPLSMVAGIHALESGTRLCWRRGGITRERFRPPRHFAAPATGNGDPATAAQSLRMALLDSVDHALADGAVAGVFVGGGIGSAALLALVRETGRAKNLRALTVGFDDATLDESDSARRVAGHFGVEHTHLRLDQVRAREWFDAYLPALDQPAVHGFPLFALCRFAHQEGVATALAGIGAGELFGGHPLYAQLPRLLDGSRRLGALRVAAGRGLLAASARPFAQRLGDFLTRAPTLPGAYAAIRGIHAAEEARAIVARFTDPTGCADPVPEDGLASTDFPTLTDAINALDLRRRLRDQLLRDADAQGCAHGLDLRLPFVDERVAETLALIPAAMRLRADRRLLRDAVPEIPSWIGTHTGDGLRFPYETWNAETWGAAKPADAIGRRTRRSWEQKWSLFLFRRWWRQFAAR